MNPELLHRAELVLGDLTTAAELTEQIRLSCAVFQDRSTRPLSDTEIVDRVSTLMDFASLLEDTVQAGRIALPQLAAFLIQFKIPAKEEGIVSDRSATDVSKLVSMGRAVLGHETAQLSDTLSGLLVYAEQNDLRTAKLLLESLRSDM